MVSYLNGVSPPQPKIFRKFLASNTEIRCLFFRLCDRILAIPQLEKKLLSVLVILPAKSGSESQPPKFREILDSNLELWSRYADHRPAIRLYSCLVCLRIPRFIPARFLSIFPSVFYVVSSNAVFLLAFVLFPRVPS